MTIFFMSRFFFNNFFQKNISWLGFQMDPTSVKQHQKLFLNAAKGAVANSSSDSSFRNGCGSAAIKFKK